MFGWLRRSPPAATLDDDAWNRLRGELRLLDALPEADLARLRSRVARFLAEKQFHATHGLEIDDRLRLVVATQCCLPALHLPEDTLSGWRDVILYPGAFRARRHGRRRCRRPSPFRQARRGGRHPMRRERR